MSQAPLIYLQHRKNYEVGSFLSSVLCFLFR